MPPPLPSPTRKQILLSAVFLAVIYVDVASIVNLSDLGIRLPNAPLARQFNGMFRVFAGYSESTGRYEVEIESGDQPGVSTLYDPHDLFPMPRGESLVRLTTLWRSGCGDLARELAKVYRSRSPDLELRRLSLFYSRWPSSPIGFEALYDARETTLLCTDADP